MNSFNRQYLIILWVLLLFTVVNANDNVACAFIQNEIVPDVVPNPPSNLLKVTYDNGNLIVNLGNELTPTQVENQPKVEYYAEKKAYYTLIMTDPDAPSRASPVFREFKHWIVVNIPGNNIDQGQTLVSYFGSAPPQGTGLHRYVFLLFKQPGELEFTEPPIDNNNLEERINFNTNEFTKKHNMCGPIAGNFFQAQYENSVVA